MASGTGSEIRLSKGLDASFSKVLRLHADFGSPSVLQFLHAICTLGKIDSCESWATGESMDTFQYEIPSELNEAMVEVNGPAWDGWIVIVAGTSMSVLVMYEWLWPWSFFSFLPLCLDQRGFPLPLLFWFELSCSAPEPEPDGRAGC